MTDASFKVIPPVAKKKKKRYKSHTTAKTLIKTKTKLNFKAENKHTWK